MSYDEAALIAVPVLFVTLAIFLVCLRFWSRIEFQKTFIGIDDWLILVAIVLVTGMGIQEVLSATIGSMGRGEDLKSDQARLTTQYKLDFAQLVFEKPAYGAIKLSVLFFYRRIFTLNKSFRIANSLLVAPIATWALTFFLTDLFTCGVHFNATWDPAVKARAHCLDSMLDSLVFTITDVLTDIAVLWMPYPEIRTLQMPPREKWAVAGVFMLGLLDLLVGIVRLGFIIATQTIPAFNANYIPPEAEAPGFWTFTEVVIGVIAANMPALSPLFKERVQFAFILSTVRGRLWRSQSANTTVVDTYISTLNNDIKPFPSHDGSMVQVARIGSVGMWNQFRKAEALNEIE